MQSLHYLSRLDHLRFYAATLLIFHHFKGSLEQPDSINNLSGLIDTWIVKGQTGVTLFLVLSGFLFCIISDAGKRKINYFSFIKNRVLRIFPLLVFIFSIIITITRATSTPMDILRLLTLQLNTGNPDTGWANEHFPVGAIWTIAVEFQFYLLFPFLAIILNKQGVKNMFGLVLLMILVKLGISIYSGFDIYYNIYHTLTGRLDQFIIGIILGYYYTLGSFDFMKDKIVYQLIILFFAITLLTILIFKFKFGLFYNSLGFSVEAFLWALVIVSYLMLSIPFPRFLDHTLSHLGALSYSMYLLHLPVGIIIIKILNHFHITFSEGVGSIVILPILLFSVLTYTFVEKPFLSMKSKYMTTD